MRLRSLWKSSLRWVERKAELSAHERCCKTRAHVHALFALTAKLRLIIIFKRQVPEEEWQCEICIAHKLHGVSNCESERETSGQYLRHEPIGADRHGRKYWFLARRLIMWVYALLVQQALTRLWILKIWIGSNMNVSDELLLLCLQRGRRRNLVLLHLATVWICSFDSRFSKIRKVAVWGKNGALLTQYRALNIPLGFPNFICKRIVYQSFMSRWGQSGPQPADIFIFGVWGAKWLLLIAVFSVGEWL